MPSRALDAEIDRLYQLPLDEFTPARNALAKGAGADAPRIKALAKPPVAAWAVNQLHWRNVDVWNALVEAAENARRAHKAVLSGRAADVRAATKVHDDAVDEALKATLAILATANHPASDATKHSILTTLRALPGDEPPGRLTRVLQPGGFEALAGLSIRGAKAPIAKPTAKPAPPPHAKGSKEPPRDTKAIVKARESVASATRTVKQAEHAAQREEFERARAAREAEKAAKAVDAARKALEEAEEELRNAETAATAATRKRESAERSAKESEAAVDAAQAAVTAAQQKLDQLER